VAVFATFVASLAHTVGGGAPPGPVALLLALAFSAPLAMLLTGARAHPIRTAASALAAQAALHLCYALGGAAPTVGTHAHHMGHAGAVPAAVLPTSAPIDHGHVWMPVAHLVAAAITVAALLLVDRSFDAIGAVIARFVRRLTTIDVPPAVPSLQSPADAPRPRLIGALLSSALGSRGPPVVPVAA